MNWKVSLILCLGIWPGLLWAQGSVSIVDQHGALKVSGNQIVNQRDEPVQLRGMSLYWSQWQPDFYNADVVRWLVEDWKCTLVRAAMAVDHEGYLENPEAEKNKVIAVVDAAIELGVYVIIDWHDHFAHEHEAQAKSFFSEMAQKYAGVPNVIYETFNEPELYDNENAWSSIIKPYHETIIRDIREHTENLIICGTRNWSQRVDEAAADPIDNWDNIAYTLHFYAATHGNFLMDYAQEALDGGIALFVTEWGTSEASGDGVLSETGTRAWWNFLDERNISWANWSVAAIEETSAALNPGASSEGNWSSQNISPSGEFVRAELMDKYEEPILNIQTGPLLGKKTLSFRAGSLNYGFTSNPHGPSASVYNMQGNFIQTLQIRNGKLQWDGLNQYGNLVNSGIYTLRLDRSETHPFYYSAQK